MRAWRGLPITAVACLSLLSTAAVADAVTPVSVPQTHLPAGVGEPSPADIGGLIVKMVSKSAGIESLMRSTESTLRDLGVEGANVSIGQAIDPTTSVLTFSEPVSESRAQSIASDLQRNPGVVWAIPDRPVYLTDSGPTVRGKLPDDPYFSKQWDVWDRSRPQGGYSVKAPRIWRKTTGARSIVVAVIDTGVTDHPDLRSNLVPGFDFVSNVTWANDGNGWDPDPSDPGDWVTPQDLATGLYPSNCVSKPSGWHGTHVMGTIAALQGNGRGVSGIAPNVRIQPIRALGKCAGYESDVLSAIRWAAGGIVPGVAPNATPAKVINLSMGFPAPCDPAFYDAISFARTQGAVVVASAGNDAIPVSGSSPGGCDNVLSVSATAIDGSLASYSNTGARLAAPGGDGDGYEILSLSNTGVRQPIAAGYAYKAGTSMAAPHVAAAAALAYSLGAPGPNVGPVAAAAVYSAVLNSVQPPPTRARRPCADLCGAGILDLSRLRAGIAAVVVTPPTHVAAAMGDGQLQVSWQAPTRTGMAAIMGYTATADSSASDDLPAVHSTCTTTGTSCTIVGLSNDRTYSVSVTAVNESAYMSYPSGNVSVTLPDLRPGPPTGVTATVDNQTVTVAWIPPVNNGGSALTGFTAAADAPPVQGWCPPCPVGGPCPGAPCRPSWPEVHLTCVTSVTTCRIDGLPVERTYTITVTATNAAGHTSEPSESIQVFVPWVPS